MRNFGPICLCPSQQRWIGLLCGENMTSKYKAFDSFVEETEETPKGFEFKGEQYILPAKLPAKTMLRGMREQKKADNEQDETRANVAQYEEFYTDLLGEEQYKRLLDTNISLQGLNKLFTIILSLYTETDEADPKASAQE